MTTLKAWIFEEFPPKDLAGIPEVFQKGFWWKLPNKTAFKASSDLSVPPNRRIQHLSLAANSNSNERKRIIYEM